MNLYEITYFASTYNCNAYGAGGYSTQGECVTTASPGTSGGILTNTGQDAIIGVGVGVVLIASAVVLMIRGRRKKATR